MKQETKDKLHIATIIFFTILMNVVFIGSTIYMIVSKLYNAESILLWGLITISLTLIWDCAVLISLSKKCSDLYDSFLRWLRR